MTPGLSPQEVLNHFPVPVCVLDGRLCVMLANHRMATLGGFEINKAAGQSLFTLLSSLPDALCRELHDEFLMAIQESKLVFRRTVRFVRDTDQQMLAWRFNAEILSVDDPEAGRLLVSIEEVFEDEASTESERLLRLVIDSSADGLVMVNESGHIELVNRRMSELFVYSTEELVGRPISILVPGDEDGWHFKLMQAYLRNPEKRIMAARRPLKARRKDGSLFPVEIGLNPMHTAQGLRVLATVVDVTKQEDTRASLEKALSEKTTLLNEVHHRVKNNLQVITSLLNLQARQGSSEFAAELQTTQNRIQTMALIHQLLYEQKDYVALDARFYLAKLGSLLKESLLGDERHIGLEVKTGDEAVLVDLARMVPMGLLVNELVMNACKHAYPDHWQGKHPHIRLKLSIENQQISLQISDNGVGLPEATLPGSGDSLGMQLIPMFVNQMGGELEISRSEGTRFSIRFPSRSAAA